MPEDPELQAMDLVLTALRNLDQEAAARVMGWVGQRLGLPNRPTPAGPSGVTTNRPSANPGTFDDFVDVLDAAGPNSGVDRALVAGYWHQVIQGKGTFLGSDINTSLKDVGHGLANVTVTLRGLQRRQPALVRQVSKAGRGAQGKKTYKLTTAGEVEVRRMLGRQREGSGSE